MANCAKIFTLSQGILPSIPWDSTVGEIERSIISRNSPAYLQFEKFGEIGP